MIREVSSIEYSCTELSQSVLVALSVELSAYSVLAISGGYLWISLVGTLYTSCTHPTLCLRVLCLIVLRVGSCIS